jgi:thiamine biosynthesis lipoprotein
MMGMTIIVDVVDEKVTESDIASVFDYFASIDRTFSTYRKDSEISRYNAGKLTKKDLSLDVRQILQLAEDTKEETHGYFNIVNSGQIDPSGIVKGWAIYNAAGLLREHGFQNYYVDAGGDMQVSGLNDQRKPWKVGIRNPFRPDEMVKVVSLSNQGVATSGNYIRGHHIYDPHDPKKPIHDIVSITVIAPTVYDADRFATAAFAMGEKGIHFIEKMSDLAGYVIDTKGVATMTSGFDRFVVNH